MANNLSKWLDLTKVVKDTTLGSMTKWDSLQKVKDIKKLNYEFQLPSFDLLQVVSYEVPVVCHQYNFTAPESFTILNWLAIRNAMNSINATTGFYLVIRFREGFNVTRYKINNTGSARLSVPYYSGQLIKPNFTLEVWSKAGEDELLKEVINPSAIDFTTSILINPQDEATTDPVLSVVSEATGRTFSSNGNLFNSFPSTNPAVFNAVGPYSDNP